MKEQRESVAGLVASFLLARLFRDTTIYKSDISKLALPVVPLPLGEDRKKLAGKVQCLDGPLQVMEFLKALSNTLGHGI